MSDKRALADALDPMRPLPNETVGVWLTREERDGIRTALRDAAEREERVRAIPVGLLGPLPHDTEYRLMAAAVGARSDLTAGDFTLIQAALAGRSRLLDALSPQAEPAASVAAEAKCPKCGAVTEQDAERLCRPGDDACPMTCKDDWSDAMREVHKPMGLTDADLLPSAVAGGVDEREEVARWCEQVAEGGVVPALGNWITDENAARLRLAARALRQPAQPEGAVAFRMVHVLSCGEPVNLLVDHPLSDEDAVKIRSLGWVVTPLYTRPAEVTNEMRLDQALVAAEIALHEARMDGPDKLTPLGEYTKRVADAVRARDDARNAALAAALVKP